MSLFGPQLPSNVKQGFLTLLNCLGNTFGFLNVYPCVTTGIKYEAVVRCYLLQALRLRNRLYADGSITWTDEVSRDTSYRVPERRGELKRLAPFPR